MENSIEPIKYVVIGLLLFGVIAGLFLLPLFFTQAQSQPSVSTASLLSTSGNSTTSSSGTTLVSAKSSGSIFSFFGGGSTSQSGHPVLTIVKAVGTESIFVIVDGKKHLIPTNEIFFSYGLTNGMIQSITAEELAKYPTARLFIIEGLNEEGVEPTIFYMTDNGMIREMLNDRVFYSYGNRKEDIITINQKEFNYYPRVQYVYLERPIIDRSIYQITGGIKRYLTPVAVRRMNLGENEIAPINQIEFDTYPEGESVIF